MFSSRSVAVAGTAAVEKIVTAVAVGTVDLVKDPGCTLTVTSKRRGWAGNILNPEITCYQKNLSFNRGLCHKRV